MYPISYIIYHILRTIYEENIRKNINVPRQRPPPMVLAHGPWAHGPGPGPIRAHGPGPAQKGPWSWPWAQKGPHMVTLSFMKWALMNPEIAILRENKVELMDMLRVIVVG